MKFSSERGLCVVNTYRSVYKYISSNQAKWILSKEHDRSGAGKEVYAALCAGCKGSDRNGMSPIRSPCGTM